MATIAEMTDDVDWAAVRRAFETLHTRSEASLKALERLEAAIKRAKED